MKIWLTLILLTLLTLTACAAPNSASPTPTIVRLDRSTLTTPTGEPQADAAPTATTIPLPTAIPTVTPTPLAITALATATLEIDPQDTPNPTVTAAPVAVRAEVLTAGLNVREGPGVSYASIGTVTQGDMLDISGVSANGNWLRIATADGTTGWISGQATYTRLLGSLKDVPIVEAAAGNQAANGSPAVGGQPSAVVAGGQIIFATRSGGDLYRVNADGTGLQKLASGVIDPVVSPDGTQVAFTRWDGANMGAVYLLNLASGSEQVVASDIARPKSPTWSQDRQHLIISFQHGGTVNPQPECREFDSDDGRQLPTVGEITSVDVGDDGQVKICFIRVEDLQWGLRQLDLATGQSQDLPADLYSFNPTWDPRNGSRIIYDGLRGLMQLDVTTGALQPFTTDVRDTAPVFSPDGQSLALTYKQHDHWEVYTYNIASGTRQRLTKPPLLADPQYSSAAPAWSPDGTQLVFLTDRTGQWEIWLMNADGSNPHPLFLAEVQAQLGLAYQGVNERLLNWAGSSSTSGAGSITSSATLTPAAKPAAAASANKSLSGAWDFAFGTMSLTQREMKIEGAYRWYGGADTGRIEGAVIAGLNQFQGLWVSDRSPNSQSLLRWQLAADGSSFSGAAEGGATGDGWCGVRSGQPLPSGCGFSGVWQLRFGNPPGMTGQATLVQTGGTVQGTYVDSQGQTGKLVDGVVTVQSITEAKLTGTWRDDQGQQDTFEWRLDLTTGRTFEGRRDPGNSEWCGWRQGTGAPEQCGWED
jgi:hypothetical protein